MRCALVYVENDYFPFQVMCEMLNTTRGASKCDRKRAVRHAQCTRLVRGTFGELEWRYACPWASKTVKQKECVCSVDYLASTRHEQDSNAHAAE